MSMKTSRIAISAFTAAMIFVIALFAWSCNRNATKSSVTMADTFAIELEEDYSKKYLMKLYGESIENIGRSSKAKNVYQVKFKKEMSVESLREQPHVVMVKIIDGKLPAPTKHKATKGKSSPIKQ